MQSNSSLDVKECSDSCIATNVSYEKESGGCNDSTNTSYSNFTNSRGDCSSTVSGVEVQISSDHQQQKIISAKEELYAARDVLSSIYISHGSNKNKDKNNQSTNAIPITGNGGDHGATSQQQQTGKFGAITNYLNTILGAGIIGIPYAISQCGCVAGVLLLLFVAALTDKSLRLIIESAKHHPIIRQKEVCTFEDLMSYTFGPYGSIFILWCMFVIAYGSMVAYLLVVKDTIPVILQMLNIEVDIGRELMLVITSMCIMLPLSMMKDLASLAFTSFLSIFAAITTVILTVVLSPIQQNVRNEGGIIQVVKNEAIKPSLFIGLSILSDAFACHHAAYIVYGSLRKPSKRRWGLVTFHSLSLATIVFTVFGLAAYLGYLDETQANILNNFPMDDSLANIARLLLTLTFFFTYPMEAIVGRHVLFAIMYPDGDLESSSNVFCSISWRYIMTFTIYIMTLVPALLFDDLGPVLALTGAIGGSSLAYITPGVLYLGVYGEEFLAYCAELLTSTNNNTQTSFQNDKGIININNLDVPIAGDGKLDMMKLNKIAKPYWWYMFGFPIWNSIASQGRNGLHKKFPRLTYEDVERKSYPVLPKEPLSVSLRRTQSIDENNNDYYYTGDNVYCAADSVYCTADSCILDSLSALEEIVIDHDDKDDDTVVRPTKYDFMIAIFYIIFGVTAMICGVFDTVMDVLENE